MDVVGVTNRKLCNDFYKRIEQVKDNINLKYLILREKDLNNNELEEMAGKVKDILKGSSIKLIINNNIEVCKNIKACGVQLSLKKLENLNLNELNFIKGISVHSFDEAVIAEEAGADYVIYGHVFETNCKKGLKPRGVDELKKITAKLNIPVYAIGGINGDNYMQVIDAGAQGFAIMSSFMENKELDYIKCR